MYIDKHNMRCLLFLIFLIAIHPVYSSYPPLKGVKTIVIDAGHGGKDPGCSGASHKEKEVTLAVALKLGKLITEKLKDVKVIYTRKTDVFVELEERAQIANRNNADLFISIHCNAAAYTEIKVVNGKQRKRDVINKRPYGSETYVMGIKNEAGKTSVMKRENAAILLEDNYKVTYSGFDPNSDESYILFSMFAETFVEQSVKFASEIQHEYKTRVGRVDKGVKRQSLWVLWRTKMPSVLTEIGYLTNPEEEKFLGSEKGQNHLAAGLFRAFRKYKSDLEGTELKFDDEVDKMEVLVNENLVRGDSSYLKEIEDFKDESDTSAMDHHEKTKHLLKEAERSYETGDFILADKKYREVLELYPTDKLSKERISTISSHKKKYHALLDEGDRLFKQSNYGQAKKYFEEAQAVMSKENYPTKKIQECEYLLKEKTRNLENKTKIEALLREGSNFMRKGEVVEAKDRFVQVLKLDSTNSEAKYKLKELNQENSGKNEEYSKLVAEADYLFSLKKYKEAKSKFYRASLINSKEEYPKLKIQEITRITEVDKTDLYNKGELDSNKVVKKNLMDNNVLIRIQFMQSPKELPIDDAKLNGLDKIFYYKSDGVYKYTAGEFLTVESALDYRNRLKDLGYKDAFLVAFSGSQRIDIKKAMELLSQKKNQ